MRLHKRVGPGLLESAYETILAEQLSREGLRVERQKTVALNYDDIRIVDAYRIDLLVERQLVIEVKATERLLPIHPRQVLTYLKMLDLRLGYVMNFGQETFAAGLKRVSNGAKDFAPSRLPLK